MIMSIKKYFVVAILCFPIYVYAEPMTIQSLPKPPELLKIYNSALRGDAKAQLKFAQYYSNIDNKNYRTYKEEFYWYKKAAEQGLAEAQVQVAKLYGRSYPFYPNISEALKWLMEAANQDYSKAQEYLAWVYLGDWGDKGAYLKNETEALKWFNKAIKTHLKNLNKQDPQQLYDLSGCYLEASELTTDSKDKQLLKTKGMEFLNLSVVLGSYEAAESLARMSDDIPLNNQKLLYQNAFQLLVKKAKEGDVKAQIKLADLYNDWDSSFSYFFQAERIKPFVHEIKYDGESIEKNSNKAFYWYSQAYKNGDRYVIEKLKEMYLLGNGTEKNYLKAFELQKELSIGRLDQLYDLGMMYLDERNPLKDNRKSFEIFKYISEKYHEGYSDLTEKGFMYDFEKDLISISQAKLGWQYLYGVGTTKDYEKAIYWLKKAANQNDSRAEYLLGEVYYFGLGVGKDYKTAFDWYMKSISTNKDDGDAQYSIGYMYEHGQGVTKSYSKALEHYTIAADLQHDSARKALLSLRVKIDDSNVNNVQLLNQERNEYNLKIQQYNSINKQRQSSGNKENQRPKSNKSSSSSPVIDRDKMKKSNEKTNTTKLIGIDRFGK